MTSLCTFFQLSKKALLSVGTDHFPFINEFITSLISLFIYDISSKELNYIVVFLLLLRGKNLRRLALMRRSRSRKVLRLGRDQETIQGTKNFSSYRK